MTKIVAQSFERYSGGAKVKRQWGSSTVTRFFVEYQGDPKSREQIEGYGKTPGERKTYAIEQFRRIQAAKAAPSRAYSVEPMKSEGWEQHGISRWGDPRAGLLVDAKGRPL